MPRKRSNYGTRRRKSSSQKKTEKTLASIKRLIPSPKSKYFDYSASNQSLTYNGTLVTTLMALSRGTGDGDRVGDAIRMLRMDVKIASFNTAAGGDNARYTFFIDKSPYIASTAALYKTTGSDLATLSPFQEDYRNDIIVLKDLKVKVDSVNNLIQNSSFSRKLNHVVRYAGATTTPVSNYLKFAAISDALAPVVNYDIWIRVWFVDV